MTNHCIDSPNTDDSTSFEEAFNRLEELVQSLEEGRLSLQETQRLYEEGMELAKLCNNLLSATELRITELRDSFMDDMSALEPEDDEQLP